MQIVTKCAKRQNEVHLFLCSERKKIVEFIYYIPNGQLIQGRTYEKYTKEDLRSCYLERLQRYQALGYEIKDKKNGKLICFPNHL
ncbi:MAG: hypothetical protein GX962_07285 [Epulopiscium sp.]|nr:hypothetical protein [Candidatus Epulonipiscium sp.]